MAGHRHAAPPLRLALGLAVFVLIWAGIPLSSGGLAVGRHEGDTLHLVDIVLRMAHAGQQPHIDFMTPLGLLGLWPIVLFSKAGFGIGHAFLAAQALLAVVLFGPVLRVATSRFAGGWAWLFAGYVMVLCLALVHGEAGPVNSISMHYNRWAWALAYIAVPLAMLEPLGPRRPVLDGALIGLAMVGLALLKATYFVALAPAVLLALLLRRDLRAAGIAVLAGLVVMGALTLLLGPGYWVAYLHDLLAVAHSSTRAAPGLSFEGVLTDPAYILGTLTALAGVVLLRRAGRMHEGLVLLALVPGLSFITYQNFGNDPQWLILLGLLAFALRPGTAQANGLAMVGVIALSLGSASAINMALSPFRKAPENALPLLAMRPGDRDLLAPGPRMYQVVKTRVDVTTDGPYARYSENAKWPEPAVLNGEPLPECELTSGYIAFLETTASDLQEAGFGGSGILVTDLLSPLWLYGDFRPLKGAAPWHYDGAPGLEGADHVLVPLCASSKLRRRDILKAITVAGWHLIEERRTPDYVLLKPVRD